MKKVLIDRYFTAIARRYDLAGAILSFGLHFGWKRAAINALPPLEGALVLDVCGGTADLALLAAERVGEKGRVIVCDVNSPMMEIGKAKAIRRRMRDRIQFSQGDAEELCFPAGTFAAATVGFGLRNLVHPEKGLSEIYRVLKPGGSLAILEFSLPARPLRSLYDLYSLQVMPRAAGLICGTSEPFVYLAESIRMFPAPERVAGMLAHAGFAAIRYRKLTGGLAAIYAARKDA
jgi:demethylmenaquinone methyltransferase/2-methoxy-6-polyprenyl-1,4-benzoquinol methylase